MTKPLIPSRFVNTPSAPVYDAELSDPHFRTYIRLRGLAWQSKYRETPPLTIEELAAICHHNVRSMWGHLTRLRDQTDLTLTSVGAGRLVLKFRSLQNFAVEPLQNFAVESLQNFAVANGVVVNSSPEDKRQQQQQQSEPLQNFAVESLQNFAVEPLQNFAAESLQNFAVDGRVWSNLEALAEYGVNVFTPQAQERARLEYVTPDFIRAWGERLRNAPGIRNLPGILSYKLETARQLPDAERRGGRHHSPPDASAGSRSPELPGFTPAAENPPSPPALPDDLLSELVFLDLVGSDALQEVTEVFAEDPDRVWGWVGYVRRQSNLTNRGGFLRKMLCSGEPAPLSEEELRRLEYERYTDAPREPETTPVVEAADDSVNTPVTGDLTAAQVWDAALGELQLEMTKATFDTWLRDSRLVAYDDGTLTVAVRNSYARDWLESRLMTTIQRVVDRLAGEVAVRFTVEEAP